MKPVYETRDGKKFESAVEAEAHNKLIATQRLLERVQKKLIRAMAGTYKTADGELFNTDTRMYYPFASWHGVVNVQEVFWLWDALVVVDNEVKVVVSRNHDKTNYVSISSLFKSEAKAWEHARDDAKRQITAIIRDTNAALKRKSLSLGSIGELI